MKLTLQQVHAVFIAYLIAFAVFMTVVLVIIGRIGP